MDYNNANILITSSRVSEDVLLSMPSVDLNINISFLYENNNLLDVGASYCKMHFLLSDFANSGLSLFIVPIKISNWKA